MKATDVSGGNVISSFNVIDEAAEIDDSVSMGHFNVIQKAKIGQNVVIGSFCTIADDVEIGDDTRVCSYVELRSGTRIGQRCWIDSGVKSSGKNEIGDDVSLRYDSIIARGCKIANGVYICPQVMTNNLDHQQVEVGGAHIGEQCFIGTQAVLAAVISIAPGVIVGAVAMVTQSLSEPGVYVGVPARRLNRST